MNDWDNFDNFPADDDDDESFDWLNDDSDDDFPWLNDDADAENDTEDDASQQTWQMPRPERAERDIASQIEKAEDAEFGNTDELLDWMAEQPEENDAVDLPDWLDGFDVPEADEDAVREAQSTLDSDNEVEPDQWLSFTDDTTDETDDFLFGAGDPSDDDDTDDFLFGAGDPSDDDDTDDFLFGAGDPSDDDDTDDFLFGAVDASDDGDTDDFLFGAVDASDDGDTDDFLLGAVDASDDDDTDDFLFGAVDASDDDDDFLFSDVDPSDDASSEDEFSAWGLTDDTDFPEDTTSSTDAETDDFGWGLSEDDDLGFTVDEDTSPTSAEPEVPDWLADMPVPSDESEPIPTEDDLGVPDWLLDADDEEPFADAVASTDADADDEFSFMDDELASYEETSVTEAENDDLLNLLGDFAEGDSDDLSDLLNTLDTDTDEDDLDDLLATLDADGDDADDLDSLFASLDADEPAEPNALSDETILYDENDDLDFLEPVSNEASTSNDDLDFLEPVSDEVGTPSSDLDFLFAETADATDIEMDEYDILNELDETQTSELDFMAGITRPQTDAENDIEQDDEFELLNQLSEMKTSELDFMEGISRIQENIESGQLNLDDLDDDELELLNKLNAVNTGELDFMQDVLRDEPEIPELDDREIAILNKLSQRHTDELDFMAGISREHDTEALQPTRFSDDDDETSDDVQAWFDAQDDEKPESKKPSTGSLAYLDKVQAPSVDDDPDWLDEISGIDTDTLRQAAEGVGKQDSVDIDELIDSFDVDDEQDATEIAPAADLDMLFSQLDEEQRQQLPDDLPADALPEWLQEIAKGTDAASAAALIRQRRDRSLDDLDDRLLDLRERGLELSPTVSAEPENQQRLAKVVPNVDEALVPAKLSTGEVGAISTAPIITPEQQKHAELLQSLVGSVPGTKTDENTNVERASNRLGALTQGADRLIIILLLIAAVIAPFVYPVFDTVGISPASEFAADSEEFAAFTLLDTIPARSYVLIAVEYGATGARELDTATRSVMEHIITRGGIPVIVSSDAVGLLRTENIAQELLGTERQNFDFYVAGLLPGGNVGLRDFTNNFTRVISTDLRNNPIDLNLDSVDDFEAIVLISESGESVRNWMEQVAPSTDTEIIVITGQAARPLAIPYVSAVDNAIALLVSYEDAFTYQQMVLARYNPEALESPEIIAPTLEPTSEPTLEPTLEPTPEIATEAATDTIIATDIATEAVPETEEIEATDAPTRTPIPSLTPRPPSSTPSLLTTSVPQATVASDTSDETNAGINDTLEIAIVSTGTSINVRSGAGTDFAVMSALESGEQVVVIQRSTDDEWVEVILPNATSGWIATELVTITDIPADEFDGVTEVNVSITLQIGTVNSDARVNVRSGPGGDFSAIAGLDPGTRVRIIGTNDAGDWYNIVLPNGNEGWVAAFLLTVEEIPEDQWDGASKDGYRPIYFSRPRSVAQDGTDEADTLLIGRNAAGITIPVYTDETQNEVLLQMPNATEFIVITQGEPLTEILLQDGRIGFIETRVIVVQERLRSEVDFAPTATPSPTLGPTFTPTVTFTPTLFPAQVTPAPLTDPETRSSSQALGLVAAIVVIALGNLFWIFRWLGQREQ